MEGFALLKAELDSQMSEIHERLSNVHVIVRENLTSEKNPDGLLTAGEANYIKCLQLQHTELEELLRQDEAHWAENREMSRRQADEIGQQVA